MVLFASRAWVERLDQALSAVKASGPPLRLCYRFGAGADIVGYDLLLGEGMRAQPWDRADQVDPDGVHAAGGTGEPVSDRVTDTVTISQSLALALGVACGTVSAQRALLGGDIEVSGPVTALVAWRDCLTRIDGAWVPLRADTEWPEPAADPT